VAVNRDIGLSVTGHDADLLNRTGETSTSASAEAAIHADYALAERLVLRGRAGWAEVLNAHNYFYGAAHATSGFPDCFGTTMTGDMFSS